MSSSSKNIHLASVSLLVVESSRMVERCIWYLEFR